MALDPHSPEFSIGLAFAVAILLYVIFGGDKEKH
jgi:hypothetical protein